MRDRGGSLSKIMTQQTMKRDWNPGNDRSLDVALFRRTVLVVSLLLTSILSPASNHFVLELRTKILSSKSMYWPRILFSAWVNRESRLEISLVIVVILKSLLFRRGITLSKLFTTYLMLCSISLSN